MSWRQRTISAAVLVVLAGLPVAGTVCALLCSSAMTADSDTAASAHHGSGANCQKLPDSAEVQPRGVSDHDCGSHAGALPEIATVAAVRADWGCVPAPLAIGIAYSSVKTLSSFEPALTHRPSHVTALLTSTPLVLRV